jgi:hypothetical protein
LNSDRRGGDEQREQPVPEDLQLTHSRASGFHADPARFRARRYSAARLSQYTQTIPKRTTKKMGVTETDIGSSWAALS